MIRGTLPYPNMFLQYNDTFFFSAGNRETEGKGVVCGW